MPAAVTEEPIEIVCADGFALRATLFGARRGGRAVVIAAALGVPRQFYAPLARHLAARGIAALSFDYRGIGDSRDGPVRGSAIRMEDWGRLDIDAALGWMTERIAPSHLFLLGHSAGGQLAGLAPRSAGLTAMVFAAVSSAYWGHWPLPARLGMFALMHAVIPALGAGREFYPAGRGLASIDVPAGVTSQWSRWARSPGYLFDRAHGLDTAGYRRLRQPLLAWQFDDDRYAPLAAHEAILAAYANAKIQRRRIRAADLGGGVGHFGYFKERRRDALWNPTIDWLLQTG